MTTRHRQLPQNMYELMHSLLYWAVPARYTHPRSRPRPAPKLGKAKCKTITLNHPRIYYEHSHAYI